MTTKPRTLHERALRLLTNTATFDQGAPKEWMAERAAVVVELDAALLEAVPRLQDEEKKEDGAALLPVDPSASPATTWALSNISGVSLIAKERLRHRAKWSHEHDDGHDGGELALHAAELAIEGTDAIGIAWHGGDMMDRDTWGLVNKHRGDPVRQLVIAGALISAEIDRLFRANGGHHPNCHIGRDAECDCHQFGSVTNSSNAEPAVERTGAQRKDPTNTLEAVPQLDDHEKNDHGAGLAAVDDDTTVVQTPKLTHDDYLNECQLQAWYAADHECGGLQRGECGCCDTKADNLAKAFRRFTQVGCASVSSHSGIAGLQSAAQKENSHFTPPPPPRDETEETP